MMDRQELLKVLDNIENRFPVGSWQMAGIDLWPILKIKIFFFYFDNFLTKDSLHSLQSEKKSTGSYIKNLLNSAKVYFGFRFQKLSKVDVLFSESKSYYTAFNDISVNKFFYPVEDSLKSICDNQLTIIRTVYGPHLQNNAYKYEEILNVSKLVRFLLILNKIKRKFYKKSEASRLPEIEKVYEFLKEHKLTDSVDLQKFCLLLDITSEEVGAYQHIYRKILKDARPKVIFELCYYSKANFALNIEAKKIGIPTIEIMHGGMGSLHVAYANWSNTVRENGFNVMPQKIWVWDKTSKDILDSWMLSQKFHSSFIGGQPWIDFMLQHKNQYSEHFNNGKKIILYTLQFDTIEDYIYEAINNSTDEYEWWLRLHPRKLYAKEDILKKLKKWNITEKVIIEEANSIPLPIIIDNTFLHLSEFSGSVIEASILGIKTIILSQIGVETYKMYINDGICCAFLEKDPLKLLNIIENHFQSDGYIKPDRLTCAHALKDILK